MKITGGQWKGRNLKVPHNIRPTTSRSKEVLFALIDPWISEAVVSDLFCGSGALGLESLSRGAQHVFFVDRSNKCIQVVRDNIEIMGVAEMCTVIAGDAFNILRKLASHGHQIDLIIADPPYDPRLTQRIVRAVADSQILTLGGKLVVEFRKGEIIVDQPDFIKIKSRLIGETGLAIWERVL